MANFKFSPSIPKACEKIEGWAVIYITKAYAQRLCEVLKSVAKTSGCMYGQSKTKGKTNTRACVFFKHSEPTLRIQTCKKSAVYLRLYNKSVVMQYDCNIAPQDLSYTLDTADLLQTLQAAVKCANDMQAEDCAHISIALRGYPNKHGHSCIVQTIQKHRRSHLEADDLHIVKYNSNVAVNHCTKEYAETIHKTTAADFVEYSSSVVIRAAYLLLHSAKYVAPAANDGVSAIGRPKAVQFWYWATASDMRAARKKYAAVPHGEWRTENTAELPSDCLHACASNGHRILCASNNDGATEAQHPAGFIRALLPCELAKCVEAFLSSTPHTSKDADNTECMFSCNIDESTGRTINSLVQYGDELYIVTTPEQSMLPILEAGYLTDNMHNGENQIYNIKAHYGARYEIRSSACIDARALQQAANTVLDTHKKLCKYPALDSWHTDKNACIAFAYIGAGQRSLVLSSTEYALRDDDDNTLGAQAVYIAACCDAEQVQLQKYKVTPGAFNLLLLREILASAAAAQKSADLLRVAFTANAVILQTVPAGKLGTGLKIRALLMNIQKDDSELIQQAQDGLGIVINDGIKRVTDKMLQNSATV